MQIINLACHPLALLLHTTSAKHDSNFLIIKKEDERIKKIKKNFYHIKIFTFTWFAVSLKIHN